MKIGQIKFRLLSPEKYEMPSKEYLPDAAVTEHLQRIEAKHDLMRYKVDGWCVWPVLRFSAGRALQNLPSSDTGGGFQRKEWIRIAARDVVKLAGLRESRNVAIVYAENRSERQGEFFKDIFFDDLLLDLGDYFKLEHISNKIFAPASEGALIKSNMTSTAIKALANLMVRAGGLQCVLEVANDLSLCLKGERGLGTLTFKNTATALAHFYWLKKLYALILRRLRPRNLFLVTAYGDHAVVAAAKEQGVQVIEFQHGFVDRFHFGYSWSPYALPFKASMPIPDRIFLYGAYWQQELAANGFWNEELRAVGSLRMDQYLKTRTNHKDDICTIVVTTQGTDTERLIAFLKDFLRLAHGQLEFRLYVKLHPAETHKEAYEAALQQTKNVRVLLSTEAPSTFELLSLAHFHVSISSTCHYEALGLGVPTVILPLASHEIVLPLHKTGYAFLAPTPQALHRIVSQSKHYQVPTEISGWYFKSDALYNMKQALAI